jgi:hypothetical protein
VVVANSVGVAHLFRRFATLIDPKPVARSYPVAVENAGLPPDATTPNPPELVLLQFGDAPEQGTEILPLVMSLNTQVVFAELPLVPSEELQLEKVSLFPSAYSVTFAFPCLCPVF